jgi:hypothetical protein
VHWRAKGCQSATFLQDITYDLTIVPAADEVADEPDDSEERAGGMMPADLQDD